MIPAPIILLLAAAAHAGPTPLSFEQSLGQLRQDVMAVRAAQLKDNSDTLARDIARLSAEARDLFWDTSDLRSHLNDLRWRAQRYPGQPQNDPFLRSDLERMIWDLRNFSERIRQAAEEAARLEHAAVKDPRLVEPAKQLENTAYDLSSENSWLDREAHADSWDFRHAGFTLEAYDIEREASAAYDYARDLHTRAQALTAKVR